jgi:hypothetical protein
MATTAVAAATGIRRRTRGFAVCAVLATAVLTAHAVPFWGAKESLPAETDPAALKDGEFVWEGTAVASGPVTVVVSLEEQRAYVYRNGCSHLPSVFAARLFEI